jgi:hypothetical protein
MPVVEPSGRMITAMSSSVDANAVVEGMSAATGGSGMTSEANENPGWPA